MSHLVIRTATIKAALDCGSGEKPNDRKNECNGHNWAVQRLRATSCSSINKGQEANRPPLLVEETGRGFIDLDVVTRQANVLLMGPVDTRWRSCTKPKRYYKQVNFDFPNTSVTFYNHHTWKYLYGTVVVQRRATSPPPPTMTTNPLVKRTKGRAPFSFLPLIILSPTALLIAALVDTDTTVCFGSFPAVSIYPANIIMNTSTQLERKT